MQVVGSFSKRIVVISGGGSAASDFLPPPRLATLTPPRPTAPVNARLVRKRRRLCAMGMKDLPLSFPVWLDRGIPGAVANCGRGRAALRCSEDHHTLATAGNPCETLRSSVVTSNGRAGERSYERPLA